MSQRNIECFVFTDLTGCRNTAVRCCLLRQFVIYYGISPVKIQGHPIRERRHRFIMKYCMECGTRLEDRFLKNEGMIPYCSNCEEYRFPVFSTACSMEVLNPTKDKILLIKQYGKDRYILVAGYVNKGENAEDTVRREVQEELGLTVTDLHFEKSEYFAPSNTLMLNFSCVVDSESLSHISEKEIDSCRWFTFEEAVENIAKGSLAGRFLKRFLSKQGVDVSKGE